MIFGWNYITMTFCNILLFSITLVIYVKLSDMDTKGVEISLVLFTPYPSLPLHLISGMVETTVLCMVLIFLLRRLIGQKEIITEEILLLWLLLAQY